MFKICTQSLVCLFVLVQCVSLSTAFSPSVILSGGARPCSARSKVPVGVMMKSHGGSFGAALGLSVLLFGASIDPSVARAAGVDEGKTGEQIFYKRCTECHINGGNRPNPARTLSKEDLTKANRNTIEAIEKMIAEGYVNTKDDKYGMPGYSIEKMGSYKGLTPTDIHNVAEYVYNAAQTGNFIKGSPWGDIM